MANTTDTSIEADAFEQALLNHQLDVAFKLLPKIRINARDTDGYTYLIRNCINNNLEAFKWLLANGGRIDDKDEDGRNLLFLAIKSNSLDIVKWLVKEKHFIETRFKNQTPLHEAVQYEHLNIVKVLAEAGMQLDIQNNYGKTALDLAQVKANKEILKWLLTYKSFDILDNVLNEKDKVNQLNDYFDKYGYEYLNATSDERNTTIAEYAASTQQLEVLKWLKSRNISVDETLLIESANTPKQTFNLLLVGETGVGKSTFINAFMNYLTFKNLEEAEQAKMIHSLISSNFTVTDENFEPKLIKFGNDANESIVPGASATQSPRSYVFDGGDIEIRLIDTPGIGDTRGISKDEENFDQLLTIIGELKHIHGIAVLLKPNNARLSVLFEYCIKQLLSRLQKDASHNIMFIFTNSRSTFYRPGDTITPLKAILDEIKNKHPFVTIPFNQKNVFCVDNEAFRFLIARRNNIHFEQQERNNFSESWKKSAKVSIDLLRYLKTLKPHKIQETVSLNEARRLILRLSIPLGEIAENIQNNIDRNNRYKENLSDKTKTIEELKQYLMVPSIGLQVVALNYPVTVCTHQNCVEAVKIEDSTKKNYKQICHNHCYLRNVEKEVIGDIELRYCTAMISKDKTRKCKHSSCGHSYLEHMHIYYETVPYNSMVEDKNVATKINENRIDMKDIENKIQELNTLTQEYKTEMETVQNSMAKFAHFLKNNAITAYNDTYKKYIEYLIDREDKMGPARDKKRIATYRQLIITYEEYKKTLDVQLAKAQIADPNQKAIVSAEEVTKLIENLYKLPRSGNTIRNFYTAQKDSVSAEILTSNERTVRPRRVPNSANRGWFCNTYDVFCPEEIP